MPRDLFARSRLWPCRWKTSIQNGRLTGRIPIGRGLGPPPPTYPIKEGTKHRYMCVYIAWTPPTAIHPLQASAATLCRRRAQAGLDVGSRSHSRPVPTLSFALQASSTGRPAIPTERLDSPLTPRPGLRLSSHSRGGKTFAAVRRTEPCYWLWRTAVGGLGIGAPRSA